jgi:hypothetical protein
MGWQDKPEAHDTHEESTAPKTTPRRQESIKALEQDGFVLKEVSGDVRRELEKLLQTKDPTELGKGKDVTMRYGTYNELRLTTAWRIDNPRLHDKYVAAKSEIKDDMEKLERKGVSIHRPDVQTAQASTGLSLDSDVSECLLLHGTSAGKLLSLLKNGLKPEFSGVNAGTAFGDGVYLAEDAAKTDQYGEPDRSFDSTGSNSALHRRLYPQAGRHPGSVFYVLVCRTPLGHPARTQQSKQHAKHMDTGEKLFPISYRELAEIPNVQPPIFYHSLIAELGRAVIRYREFIIFHGERVCPEYLLAYQRCHNGSVVQAR